MQRLSGANPTNNLIVIAQWFADRIHFAHLRTFKREPDGSVPEPVHLDGDTDMGALFKMLMDEEARRRTAGQMNADKTFRPYHRHKQLDDLKRQAFPGYRLTGRMGGLAELRGFIAALSH